MNRYSVAQIVKTAENTNRRYTNIKYPLIQPSSADTYLYTGQGDRYDTLALTYYRSEERCVGAQIRIPAPARIPTIISNFQNLNNISI
jgi:hypothetical protein